VYKGALVSRDAGTSCTWLCIPSRNT